MSSQGLIGPNRPFKEILKTFWKFEAKNFHSKNRIFKINNPDDESSNKP